MPPTNNRVRFPLSLKILLWFFANLLFLAVVAAVVAQMQFGLGFGSLLAGQAGSRVQALAEVAAGELSHRPSFEWTDVLDRMASAYQVQLALYRPDGARLAGTGPALPPEVQLRLRLDSPPPPRPPPVAEGPPPPPRPFPKTILHAGQPPLYWVIVRLPPLPGGGGPPKPAVLVLTTASLRDAHLLFDATPWVLGGLGVLAVSGLLWLPFARGLTSSLRKMTAAAREIARGRFDTQLDLPRRDELGELAADLNHMAARLQEFFTGQKRFLGDIAHELCSPLARMEMALGILEERAAARDQAYVADVREEVRLMSSLVQELLSFSKAAGAGGHPVELGPLPLRPLLDQTLRREAIPEDSITLAIPENLTILGQEELLQRAIGNVLRNAIRHAAPAGPIRLSAATSGPDVTLSITDQGPGVPPEALHRLFDPFFRPDQARTRESGGAGLGLAIVKSAVEACNGRVAARNVEPHGLCVELTLRRA